MYFIIRSKIVLSTILVLLLIPTVHSTPPKKDFYQIRIYKLKSNEQIQKMDAWLKDAYLPALHRAGIKKVGVFKPLSNDTAAIKSIYVFIPFTSEKEFFRLDKKIYKDEVYLASSKSFREAPSAQAPYDRMESILLEAFKEQKQLITREKKPGRVFEWRSYESPTLDLHEKKIWMFENEEITLFKKLDFNVIFYARVISGSRMPNFIYLPSFDSVEDRNAHWKTFGADPDWKAMQAKPEYESRISVSRNENFLMIATDYSDL